MSDVWDRLRGRFVVIDGPEGSGKGTQLERLEALLRETGQAVVRAKDPGGTAIGDRIRHVLLGYDLSEMDVRCETLLFMASRAQLVAEVVTPALAAGQTVLCDRFISATCAYQGAAGFAIEEVIALGHHAVGDVWPTLTIVLDVPAEVGFERIGRRPHHAGRNRRSQADQAASLFDDAEIDAMEARPLEFHRRVRQIFLKLGPAYPRPVIVVDGTGSPDQTFERMTEAIRVADF